MLRTATPLAALILLAACTQPVKEWNHSGVSDRQWDKDRNACKAWAHEQTKRDYDQQPVSVYDDEPEYQFGSFMSTFDINRSEQSYLESCLKSRGYRPHERRD